MRKGLSPVCIVALVFAVGAGTSRASLVSAPGVQPAYLGSLPQNPPTPFAGVSGSFNSNVDAYPDVAVVNYGNGLLLTYEANPIGTLFLTHTYGIFNLVGPHAIAAGDVNGDGKLDLVVGDFGGLSILLGDGNGNFAAASPQRPAGLADAWVDGIEKIFLKDLNHDGRLDIVAVKDDPGGFFENGELHLVVLLGTGGGHFGPPDDYDLDAEWTISGTMFALDDFDGDGQPDIMFDDSTEIDFMKGHANGKFDDRTKARDLLSSNLLAANTAEARDMDGDGKLDFVAASSDALFWCKGNGNGTLQAPVKIANLSADFTDPSHMLLLDVNKDGRPDIVVGGGVYLQAANHTFAFAEDVGATFNVNPLATADLNEDTRPDLVMQGPDPNTIAVLLSTSGPATHVLVTGGGGQSTTIGTPFPTALSLQVLDANNVGVKNLQVTFSGPPGFGAGALLSPGITFTDPTGAAADTATANNTIGCYTVNATVQGLAGSIPYDLCNTAPDHMSVTGGDGQSAQIGAAFGSPLQVTVFDGSNSPKPGVAVTFFAPPSGGSAPSAALSPITAVTNGSGIAQTDATANLVAGAFTVGASAPGLAPVSFSLSNSNVASAAAQITFDLLTSPQSQVINHPFSFPLKVQVLDSMSNPVSGATVVYAVLAAGNGAGANLSTATAVSDGSGFAQISATADGFVGSYGVKVAIQGNPNVAPKTISLRNFAPLPRAMALGAGTPQATPILTAFAQKLSVTLTDSLGNPTPQVLVYFVTPTSGPSATLSANAVLTDANGVAEVTATANGTPGSYAAAAYVFHTTIEKPIFQAFALTNEASAQSTIPTLSWTGLALFGLLLAAAGWWVVRR